MIWHVAFAALTTYLVLVGLTRSASYLYFELAGMPGEPPKLLLFATAIILASLAALTWLLRRLTLRRRHVTNFAVDMRVLSKDEQIS